MADRHEFDAHSNAWCLQDVTYYDSSVEEFKKGDIEIRDGEIKAIAQAGSSNSKTVISGAGKLCLPGLVNAHLHPSKELYGGLSDFDSIQAVLDAVHRNNHLETVELQRLGSRYSLYRALLHGVTTVGVFTSRPEIDIEEIQSVGMRAVVHFSQNDQWIGSGTKPSFKSLPEIVQTYRNCAERYDSSKLTICPATASELSASAGLLTELHRLAVADRRRFALHIHEGMTQVMSFHENTGCSAIKFLHELGILDEHCVLIHACFLSEDDLTILSSSKAAIIHCPISNSFVGAGRLPLRKLLAGRDLGIGTDAAMVNPMNHVGFDGLYALYAHGVFNLEEKATAAEIFNIMTLGGASALGISDVGAIRPGYRADLCIYEAASTLRAASLPGLTALQTTLFHPPETVYLDGKIVVQHGRLVGHEINAAIVAFDEARQSMR